MDCCFIDFIAKCEDLLIVRASLSPGSAYRWVITDKFDHKYQGESTATGEGLEIPVEELPKGLLTQYAGEFTLQIYDESCSPIKFKMVGEYDCITFEVKGGTFEKNTLGCENVCTGADQNLLIPFTNESTVSVDYSAYIDQMGNNPLIQVYHEQSPGVYQLVEVEINQIRSNGTLTDIEVDNGGSATGYILLS